MNIMEAHQPFGTHKQNLEIPDTAPINAPLLMPSLTPTNRNRNEHVRFDFKTETRLEHSTECPICGNRFSWTRLPTIFGCGFTVSECEANEQALAHWIFSIGHLLQCSLFVMDLLVLGHICLIAEIVEITCIGLGVEFWDERSTLRSECVPINFSKVLIRVDILDVGESLTL